MPFESIGSDGETPPENASALQTPRPVWRLHEQPQARIWLHVATRSPLSIAPARRSWRPGSARRPCCSTYIEPLSGARIPHSPPTPPPPNGLPLCRGPGCRAKRGCPDRRHQRRVRRAGSGAPCGHCGTTVMARARPRDDFDKPLEAPWSTGHRASFPPAPTPLAPSPRRSRRQRNPGHPARHVKPAPAPERLRCSPTGWCCERASRRRFALRRSTQLAERWATSVLPAELGIRGASAPP
jgi:hypothetical protein